MKKIIRGEVPSRLKARKIHTEREKEREREYVCEKERVGEKERG